jgi:chemotaxis signal transduction protein
MATFKVIILPIANYLFAIPMSMVLQVRRCPPDLRNSPVDAELTNLDDRPVLVLNLQLRLEQSSTSSAQASTQASAQTAITSRRRTTSHLDQFLVLTQSRTGELCGLRVDRLPDMLDLPASTVQTLPESYRQNNLQGLAKYVAIIPKGEKKMVIYLLELEQLLLAKHRYPAMT